MKRFVPLLALAATGCASVSSERLAELDRGLVIAAFQGDPERMERLIADGAEVDGRCGPVPKSTFAGDQGGWPLASARWTPLIAAASSERTPAVPDGHLRAVQILVDRGADLNAHDGHGGTALYAAVYRASRAKNDHAPLVRALLRAGADVNTKTGVYIDGAGDETPLHRAVGSPSLVDLLIRHGADVDAQTTDGGSVLHWAVLSEVESVRLLLKAGAKTELRDRRGRTAFSWVSSTRRHAELRRRVLEDASLTEGDKEAVLRLMDARGVQPWEEPAKREMEALFRAAGAKD